MHTALNLVLLAMWATHAGAAGPALPRRLTHVRPLTETAAKLLTDATEGSSIVKALVADLEQTDVVVYLSDAMARPGDEPAACLTFVSHAAATRYLLVRIDRRAAPWVRTAELGHELQHALEIARVPEVTDGASLAQMYRRIGWEGRPGRFETDAARRTGSRVSLQVARRGR